MIGDYIVTIAIIGDYTNEQILPFNFILSL